MKDIAVKESAVEEEREEVKTSGKVSVTMTAEKDEAVEVKEQEKETDDSAEKILNNITAGVQKMNIKPDEEDEKCKSNIQGDEQDAEKDAEEDEGNKEEELIERGPNGGRPTDHGVGPANMMNKSLGMPLMLSDGSFFHCDQPTPMPCQRNGNRRSLDEDDYGQPMKYNRPVQPFFDQPQVQPPPSNFSIGGNFQMNNLNDMSKFPQQGMQPVLYDQTSMYPDFGQLASTTTTMKSAKATSGGQVTVQTPTQLCPSTPNIFDELLSESETYAPQMCGNLPTNITSPSPGQMDHTGLNYSEYRRQSQDTDSGLESEGVGSPWSEQAPSPGNMYQNPASVDSGCGRSPMHETQNMPGMSPPKYPGTPSPASLRATPSPAATSGYGSPGQPQIEDTYQDFFNKKGEELDMVLDVLKGLVKEDPKLCQGPAAAPSQTVVSNPSLIPQTVQQPVVQATRAPTQVQAQPVPSQPSFQPQNVATSSTGQIIILNQQPMTQPVLFVPVTAAPTQPPKRLGLRKILPKISTQQPTGSGATASSMSSSANQNCKTGVTMATSSAPVNRNIMNQANKPDQAQQNKLLMIARRSVADIPREKLVEADTDGDTILHIAVCKTDRYMIKALLERLAREGLQALVDQENNKRQTPLYLAVFLNQPVMVAMFITFQANVNVLAQNRSGDGMTTEVKAAIHVAASLGKDYQLTLTELLRAKDISINIVNNYGQTALHCAILAHGKAKRNSQERIDSTEIIKTLIKAGADPSAQDKKSGKTPLMYAIEQKNPQLVETILKCVDPDKVKNVVKTQAFDGSSCIKIAEGLKGSFDVEIWNKLWNYLQSAANGSITRHQFQAPQVY